MSIKEITLLIESNVEYSSEDTLAFEIKQVVSIKYDLKNNEVIKRNVVPKFLLKNRC